MTTPQYQPLGYVQITGLGSATGLGAIPAGATMALISVSGANVRWRDDGTAPTANVGLPLIAGQEFSYSGTLSGIRFIAVSGSPVLDVSFYKDTIITLAPPANKLAIYNQALGHLAERRLVSLTENREPRRVLDDYWDSVIGHCLARRFWKPAKRVVSIDASATVIPQFGWKYAFNLPGDWVRTYQVSSVETFTPPLWDYAEEAGFLFASFTPLFVSYISNDPTYGMDSGKWSQFFFDFVALRLATQACSRITGKAELLAGPDGLLKREKKAEVLAASIDAMNDPPGQMPTGTWARSRRGFLRGTPLPGGTGYDD
jgi:hypothetical protein